MARQQADFGMTDSMRIGVFGGTFDPVHQGHLQLAESCQQQARLDEVWFVPACRQPHKPGGPAASGEDRTAMLRLATGSTPGHVVWTGELERGGVSYTVDTLRAIRAREPQAELFFLMGADSLADLPHWREARAVCKLAVPLVVRRAGRPEPDFDVLRDVAPVERVAAFREAQVEMPETPISSSEIRRLIAEGGAWQELVPPKVAAYIEERGLYSRLEALRPPEQLEER
jgi:nicotinate-nucleotide adenylyltransferase